jgi:membrane protein DedA with SNARE-associated domain
VARSERWFAERGTPILVFSRMIPAARLPTYLAAGFLRLPLSRFLMVTGPASFVWVFFVLFLSRTFGKRLAHWLDAYKHAGLLLIAVVAGVFILLQVLRRVVMRFKSRQLAAKQHLDDSIPATRLDGSG